MQAVKETNKDGEVPEMMRSYETLNQPGYQQETDDTLKLGNEGKWPLEICGQCLGETGSIYGASKSRGSKYPWGWMNKESELLLQSTETVVWDSLDRSCELTLVEAHGPEPTYHGRDRRGMDG